MTTPSLFDTTPAPVKGQPWPWPTPEDFDTLTYPRCPAITPAYCHRDPEHDGPHAESNAAGNVTAVWAARTTESRGRRLA